MGGLNRKVASLISATTVFTVVVACVPAAIGALAAGLPFSLDLADHGAVNLVSVFLAVTFLELGLMRSLSAVSVEVGISQGALSLLSVLRGLVIRGQESLLARPQNQLNGDPGHGEVKEDLSDIPDVRGEQEPKDQARYPKHDQG